MRLQLFSGNAHPALASDIARVIGVNVGESVITRFSDGEINIRIDESVRGSDVFVVQSLSAPVNEHIMELLIMIDALRRASARSITAVIPYYAYARQDRKAKARDPISAKLLANLLQAAGVSRVLTMDLHAPQLQGYFDIPVDHILGVPLFTQYFSTQLHTFADPVAVSPDVGSVKRCRQFADRMRLPIAIIDKRRPKPGESEVLNIIGDVRDRDIIIVDDMIDTAGTLCNAAVACREAGAKRIVACATHGVLSGEAMRRIDDSPIDTVLLLDTIDVKHTSPKLQVLSSAKIIAEVIMRICENVPVSPLFD